MRTRVHRIVRSGAEERAEALRRIEGDAAFDGRQRFFDVVATLARERRLSRLGHLLLVSSLVLRCILLLLPVANRTGGARDTAVVAAARTSPGPLRWNIRDSSLPALRLS
jgi:hypothetical protein